MIESIVSFSIFLPNSSPTSNFVANSIKRSKITRFITEQSQTFDYHLTRRAKGCTHPITLPAAISRAKPVSSLIKPCRTMCAMIPRTVPSDPHETVRVNQYGVEPFFDRSRTRSRWKGSTAVSRGGELKLKVSFTMLGGRLDARGKRSRPVPPTRSFLRGAYVRADSVFHFLWRHVAANRALARFFNEISDVCAAENNEAYFIK